MRGGRFVVVAALALCASGSTRAADGWKSVAAPEADAAAAAAGRAFGTARFVLELDGKQAGWVRSVEGGGPVGEVALFRSGFDPTPRKILASLHFAPIRVTVGAELSPDVAAWVREFLAGSSTRKSGAIVMVDVRGQVRARLTFQDAFLTELDVPALDARSREPIVLGLVLDPERTVLERNPGGRIDLPPARRTREATDFQLDVGQLDGSGILRVEPLVITRKLTSARVGETRDPIRLPGPLEVSDPVVTLSAARADDWYQWTDDFLIGGDSGDARKRPARLSLLGPDHTEVFALSLDRAGIRALRTSFPAGDTPQRVEATLFVERAALVLP